MRKRRFAGWILIGILGLVALAGIALWTGLSSDRVARALLARALARSGDMVQIGRIRGTLNGPLILNDVRIRTDVFAATIDSVLFDWTPVGLVSREVRVDVLHATGVHVELPDSTPRDTAQPQRPELPLDVLLGDVVIQDISVDAPGDVGLADGWATLDGTAEDYHLVARGRAFTPQLDSVPFTLDGRGNLERLDLDSARVDLLEGHVDGRGRVAWWPRVSWELALGATDVRPALLMASPEGWEGRVSAAARTGGYLDSLGAHGRLLVDSLAGELRGYPLRGTSMIGFEGTTIAIDELDATWGSARVDASGTVAERLDLRFDGSVGNIGMLVPDAAGSLTASGTVTGPRDAAVVQAALGARGLRMGGGSIAQVEGDARVGLAPDGVAELDLRGRNATAGQVVLERVAVALQGTRPSHRVTIDAESPKADVRLAAAGGLRETTWSGTLDDVRVAADVLGTWQLERPAALTAGADLVRLGDLCLRGSAGGNGETPRICATGQWRGNYDWAADASVERLPLALLDSLVPDTAQGGGRALQGVIDAGVNVAASGGRLDGTVTLAALDAAVLFPIPGDTGAERIVIDTAAATLTFDAAGATAAAALRFQSADGTPYGAVTATAALPEYRSLRQRVADQVLEAQLDAAVEDLSFAGLLTDRIDSLTGQLAFAASGAGTVGRPRLEATLALDQIVAWLGESRVARGSVDASLDGGVGPGDALSGTLTVVPRGVIYEYMLADVPRTVAIDSGGLEIVAADTGIRGRLGLGVSDSAATRIATFTGSLSLPDLDRLGEPLGPQRVAVRFTADLADLAVLQTTIQQFDTLTGRLLANLTVDGTVAAPRIEGTAEVREMLARFPHGGALTGGLDARLAANVAPDSSLTGTLAIVPTELALRVVQGDSTRSFPIDSTGLDAAVDANGLRAALALRIAGDGRTRTLGTLGGDLRLPGYTRLGTPLDAEPLAAELTARADDLAFVEALTGQVDSMAGRLELDADFAGTVGQPLVTGALVLENGAARLPLLGVLYDDIQLTARAANSEAFSVAGRLRSGGTLTLSGTYPLRPSSARPATLQIEGTDFQAIDTDDIHAIVSPDLTVRLAGDSLSITGSVDVPQARLELEQIPEFAIAPSDDVVFVPDTAGLGTETQAFSARVRIELGDSVSFSGFNFDAELDGSVLYIQEPEQIATASGEVVIEEGHYEAYGQDLTIENGTFRFAGGPVDDPGLAIRATRTADDGTVAGLQIGGTLQSPEVTIFSEPPMAQGRALAYIMLGRAPGEGTVTAGSLLSRAATSLGLRGGNALVGSLGRGLGLSQAGIETEGGAESAQFVAGTYLAPNVFVSYGVGLFDPATILRLRYDLSDRWSIQVERGAAAGGDLLFKTERGE